VRVNFKEANMKILAGMIAAVALAVPAAASELGGHWFDAGVIFYGQDVVARNRGGAKAEIRVNLAPEEPETALYLGLGVGKGSWKQEPISKGSQYNLVMTDQTWLDFGPGISWKKTTHFEFGISWIGYDTRVVRHTTAGEYRNFANKASGSLMGGYGAVGVEIPIGHWLVPLMVGYRETKGDTDEVQLAGYPGPKIHVKPIKGPFVSLGLRMKF